MPYITVTNATTSPLGIGNGRVSPTVNLASSASTTLSLGADELTDLRFALDALGTSKVTYVILDPVTITVRVPFTAGVAGTADDVTIFATGGIPHKYRVLKTEVLVSTLKAAATVTLYSAIAGGGTQLSTAISVAATGRIIDANAATNIVAKTDGIFLRRSDRSCAGEVIITLAEVQA